jgi:hypothetical protein
MNGIVPPRSQPFKSEGADTMHKFFLALTLACVPTSTSALAHSRPVRRAAAVHCVTEKAPLGELYRSRGSHYDVYQGGVSFDDLLRVELKFLHRKSVE